MIVIVFFPWRFFPQILGLFLVYIKIGEDKIYLKLFDRDLYKQPLAYMEKLRSTLQSVAVCLKAEENWTWRKHIVY